MTSKDDQFYQFFLSNKQVKGFKGFVGYGIKELSPVELTTHCLLNSSMATTQQNFSLTNFTSDFSVRTFTSGCYYYNVSSGKWSSDGLEVLKDTDLLATHCLSSHLTTFAGGLVVLPSAINFEYVWANASFVQNPVIYSTVIAMICLYVLLLLLTRYMDKKDRQKMNIVPLIEKFSNHEYFYEVIVFTGDKTDSATDSNVKFILNKIFGFKVVSKN